jgi:hypothetical protein
LLEDIVADVAPAEHRLCCGGVDNMLMDRRVRELVLISLLAAFCAGLAWDHDQKLFAAAFAVAGAVAGFEAGRRMRDSRK